MPDSSESAQEKNERSHHGDDRPNVAVM